MTRVGRAVAVEMAALGFPLVYHVLFSDARSATTRRPLECALRARLMQLPTALFSGTEAHVTERAARADVERVLAYLEALDDAELRGRWPGAADGRDAAAAAHDRDDESVALARAIAAPLAPRLDALRRRATDRGPSRKRPRAAVALA
jgi:hypothetical protein